jgi:hypothetical protein
VNNWAGNDTKNLRLVGRQRDTAINGFEWLNIIPFIFIWMTSILDS